MAGAIDEDAARTVASGRETVGAMLSSAQTQLKKVFLTFLVGMLGAFFVLRWYVWDALKRDILYSKMTEEVASQTSVVAVTPFDVILLQVKVGLIVGVITAVPMLVWVSRSALKNRGIWPDEAIPRWKLFLVGLFTIVLFVAGVSYAYELFFPIMFNFLATNAVNVGFTPTYSIVKWTEFVFFLTLSFGLAAQLPLAMSGLALTGAVPYETFRDKWRYAVLGIFAFGAMFSPPDPFTQIMWAIPLIALYGFSLGVTKLAVLSRRAGAEVPVSRVVRKRWNILAGTALLVSTGFYFLLARGALAALNEGLAFVESTYRFPTFDQLGQFGLTAENTAALYAIVVATVATLVALFYLRITELEAVAAADRTASRSPTVEEATTDQAAVTADERSASAGSPAEINIGQLNANAINAAPREAFEALSEQEALELAQDAVDEENADKAEAILDRFEEVHEEEEEEEEEVDDTNPVTSTAAGMANAFTEDETDEEDIGGYYYDIAFILDSLTSKAIWVVGLFMAVLAGTFLFLYQGGIRVIKNSFLSSMPDALATEVNIVTLHPVEALIFEIKFSTLLAALSIIPLVLYFAWPAIEDRGLTTGGNRNILLVWGGSLFASLIVGTLLGFFYIAPTVIAWLAGDALSSNMIIAYRINNFGWLVIFTTIGVGVLAMIPVTMWLFVRGNILSYATLRTRWRVFVIGVFAVAGFGTPKGVFTMFIVAIPAAIAYGIGLGALGAVHWLRH